MGVRRVGACTRCILHHFCMTCEQLVCMTRGTACFLHDMWNSFTVFHTVLHVCSSKERRLIVTFLVWIFGPKTLNSQISAKKGLSPAKLPLCSAPFLEQKALKTANSEKCVFRSCVECAARASKFARFPPKTAQVFAVLQNPFSTPKSLRIPAR